jgi:hypothetical protein
VELKKGQKLDWVFIHEGKGQREERLRSELVHPKPCGKQKSQMFWTAFGYGLRTVLVPMEGDPDAAGGGVIARVYKEVLNRHLPAVQFGAIFIHDNAPIHTANIIRDWPPYSPDLNPIENM